MILAVVVTSPISRPENTDSFMLCFINQSGRLKKTVAEFVPKIKYDNHFIKTFLEKNVFSLNNKTSGCHVPIQTKRINNIK